MNLEMGHEYEKKTLQGPALKPVKVLERMRWKSIHSERPSSDGISFAESAEPNDMACKHQQVAWSIGLVKGDRTPFRASFLRYHPCHCRGTKHRGKQRASALKYHSYPQISNSTQQAASVRSKQQSIARMQMVQRAEYLMHACKSIPFIQSP